jgi:Putative Ig domain
VYNFTAEVGGCGGGGGAFAELKLCAVLLVRVWRSLSPSPQVLSGANGYRHCPSRFAVAGNLMTGTAARTWFVATLAFALAGCGGAGMGQRPPVISAFTASPTDAVTGHRITLSWTVSGATDLSISGVGAVAGSSTDVHPTTDIDYVLTATNAAGAATKHVQVTLYPPPVNWFAPFPHNDPGDPGVLDFFALFNAGAPWDVAAAHIQVFKMYEQIMAFPDASLRTMFADLRRRHIALALEFGPLLVSTCGGGEGFRDNRGLQTAQRIRDLGGVLQYIAFDEPYFFGAISDGPNPCHYTPDEVAANAKQSVDTLRTVFPDLVVGDIEVVPSITGDTGWLDGYQRWVDAWQRVTGEPLAFFDFDVPIDGDWRGGVEAMRRALKIRGVPFGLIYVGEGNSDAEWVASAEQFASDYENKGGTVPDQRIFQSWIRYPRHVLPETDPNTFTYAINRYFRPRTQLVMQSSGGVLQGQLSTPQPVSPVAGAAIAVTAVPLAATGLTESYIERGTIPVGTQSVVFGARVNTECVGQGAADVQLTDFILDAGPATRLTADFSALLQGWGYWGNPDLVTPMNGGLHFVVSATEYMGLNHDAQPLAADGAAYELRVRAALAQGEFGNGCLIAVFLDSGGAELSRASLFMLPQSVDLGTAVSASDGSFTQNLSLAPAGDYELWASFAGSASLWPSVAYARIASVPDVSIDATVLPSAAVGAAYMQTLSARGGRPPYLWVASGLPPGMKLLNTGVLQGSPSSAGTYTVDVTAIDDATPSGIAQRTWTLTVQ